MVKSAFIAFPNIFPVFEQTPEGISTETTLFLLEFIFVKILLNPPLIFLFNPIPNKASITRVFLCNLNKFILSNLPL